MTLSEKLTDTHADAQPANLYNSREVRHTLKRFDEKQSTGLRHRVSGIITNAEKLSKQTASGCKNNSKKLFWSELNFFYYLQKARNKNK